MDEWVLKTHGFSWGIFEKPPNLMLLSQHPIVRIYPDRNCSHVQMPFAAENKPFEATNQI